MWQIVTMKDSKGEDIYGRHEIIDGGGNTVTECSTGLDVAYRVVDEHNKTLDVYDTIQELNNLLPTDHDALASLLFVRSKCSKYAADHPTIQVRSEKNNRYSMSVLGLLNGLVQDGDVRIAAVVDFFCKKHTDQLGIKGDLCPICGKELEGLYIRSFQPYYISKGSI
jgi:hypothetical protein